MHWEHLAFAAHEDLVRIRDDVYSALSEHFSVLHVTTEADRLCRQKVRASSVGNVLMHLKAFQVFAI
jgi:hypothetical protein